MTVFLSPGFAKGAREAPPAPINDTWTLCVTEFDSSALPPARAVMGQMVVRYIIENMDTAETRLWTSEEAAYYNKAARLKAESEAAKNLAAKQAERDKLIFNGESSRRYKQNLKKAETDLAALRTAFEKSGVSVPPIAVSPSIKLTEGNLTGSFPAPPENGKEYYFCTEQKADAFLTGKMTDYFGRFYVEISLWSVYARRVTYTDNIIFSPEDIKESITELSDRLFDHISGFLSSWIRVKAVPPDATIIVENNVSSGGETEIINFTPGTVSVTAFAPDYETFESGVDLREGELADVTVTLLPIPVDEFDVRLNEDAKAVGPAGSASLYDGALYAGQLPMTLRGPSGQQRELSVETSDGKVAQTVFRVSSAPIVFDPKMPPPDDRTDNARKKFYSAYGRFWIALPLAVLGMGLSGTMTNTYNMNPSANRELGQQQEIVSTVSLGLNILMGVCLAETFYRIGRYVWEANKESSPLIKKKPEAVPEMVSTPEATDEAEKTGGVPESAAEDGDEDAEDGDAGETPPPAPETESKQSLDAAGKG
jgi:hypothetical protein